MQIQDDYESLGRCSPLDDGGRYRSVSHSRTKRACKSMPFQFGDHFAGSPRALLFAVAPFWVQKDRAFCRARPRSSMIQSLRKMEQTGWPGQWQRRYSCRLCPEVSLQIHATFHLAHIRLLFLSPSSLASCSTSISMELIEGPR